YDVCIINLPYLPTRRSSDLKLLCLNYEDRHNLTLLKLYIQYFWPFLNYQESNSYHTLDEYRENKVQVTDIINNISILNPMNVSIRSEGDSMFVKPMSNVVLKDNIISFVLVNDDDIDKTINIKSYYSHPEKNIFLHLDNKKYSINHFYNSIEMVIESKSSKKIQFEYSKNFKGQSWYNAGEISIS